MMSLRSDWSTDDLEALAQHVEGLPDSDENLVQLASKESFSENDYYPSAAIASEIANFGFAGSQDFSGFLARLTTLPSDEAETPYPKIIEHEDAGEPEARRRLLGKTYRAVDTTTRACTQASLMGADDGARTARRLADRTRTDVIARVTSRREEHEVTVQWCEYALERIQARDDELFELVDRHPPTWRGWADNNCKVILRELKQEPDDEYAYQVLLAYETGFYWGAQREIEAILIEEALTRGFRTKGT